MVFGLSMSLRIFRFGWLKVCVMCMVECSVLRCLGGMCDVLM